MRRNVEGVYEAAGGRPDNLPALNASLQAINDSAIVVHFHGDADILDMSGGNNRFQTLIEAGKLRPQNIEMRHRAERALFGSPREGEPGIFYGVLQDKSEGSATSSANSYGKIAFTLKDNVKTRSTMTRGDSLNRLSLNNFDPVAAFTPAVPVTQVEAAFLGEALRSGDEILAARSVNDLRAVVDRASLPPGIDLAMAHIQQSFKPLDYFEVQIHGGLTADDVRHAEFGHGYDNKEVREWLTRNNIPIR